MDDAEIRAIAAVSRGAKWLDYNQPGWWCRIEKTIDIADNVECVLGQLFGDFLKATEAFTMTPEFTEYFGFAPTLIAADEGYTQYIGYLNKHWNELVQVRKQQWGLA